MLKISSIPTFWSTAPTWDFYFEAGPLAGMKLKEQVNGFSADGELAMKVEFGATAGLGYQFKCRLGSGQDIIIDFPGPRTLIWQA